MKKRPVSIYAIVITTTNALALPPDLFIIMSSYMKKFLSSFSVVGATVLTAVFSCGYEAENDGTLSTGTPADIILRTKAEEGTPLDIFFFNNDAGARLDSYQKVDIRGGTAGGTSRSGSKIMAVIANSGKDRYFWAGTGSFEALCKYRSVLADEDPDAPVMSGTAIVEAGTERVCTMNLEPVSAEIALNSIRADFTGKPGYGGKLTDVKVYLTNLRAEYPVFGERQASSVTIENYGRLDSAFLARMKHPEMVARRIGSPIGAGTVKPDIRLYCYPDHGSEDALGAPLTRLVVEGKIDGRTYYYPLDINRGISAGHNGNGIERGYSYVFDILITRRGSTDPDTPVVKGEIQVSVAVRPWQYAGDSIINYNCRQ